jgi:hypothetical protein
MQDVAESNELKLLVDPGSEFSGFCFVESSGGVINVISAGIVENIHFKSLIYESGIVDSALIETISGSTNAGKTVIDTLVWTGRFKQILHDRDIKESSVSRQSVVNHIRNKMKSGKDNVTSILIGKMGNDSLVRGYIKILRSRGVITGAITKSHSSAALALEIYTSGI